LLAKADGIAHGRFPKPGLLGLLGRSAAARMGWT
jgi:hypothetical protein